LAPLATGVGFQSLVPARLLDTRPGTTTIDGAFAGTGTIGAAAPLDLLVTGRGGVPASGVGSVVLNVTVTAPAVGGYITVWPTGDTRPNASNLNFATGQTIANLVVAKVGTGGRVSLFTDSTAVHVIADVVGFANPAGVSAINPQRLLDTRSGTATADGAFQGGGALGAGGVLSLPVTGRPGVPASGVRAVVLNVTVTNPTAGGYLTVWPAGDGRPNASNLNFTAGVTIPNLVIVKVGAGGAVNLFNEAGRTDLIADVVGYFDTGAGYEPLSPARLLDTRPDGTTIDGNAAGVGAIGPGDEGHLVVTGRGGVPGSGVGTVVLNVTAVAPTAAGYLSVWPTGDDLPNASNLNFVAAQTIPNLVVAKVGDLGRIGIFNSLGDTHVIVDVVGWFPAVDALSLSTYELPPGQVGTPYSGDLVTTGGERPYVFSTDGVAPGLAFGPSSGTLTGTPTTAGTFSAAYTAQDGLGQTRSLVSPQTIFPAGSGFTAVAPTVVYSSFIQPVPVEPDGTRTFGVLGVGGVPSTGVSSVVLRVAAVSASAGFLTVWPAAGVRPDIAHVTQDAGVVASNLVVVPVISGGQVSVYTSSSAHFYVELVGWIGTGAATTPVMPYRLHDSRFSPGPLSAGQSRDLQVAGIASVPGGAGAVLLNVTTGELTAPGSLSVHASGAAPSAVPTVRTDVGSYGVKFVLAPIGPDGKVSFRNNGASSTLLIVDVVGYVTG
jgi:hypothetical protein